MFFVKYKVTLVNNEVLNLYGEDYYNDKLVFNNMHIIKLKELYKKVLSIGFPLQICDLEFNKTFRVNAQKDFDMWLANTQPKFK